MRVASPSPVHSSPFRDDVADSKCRVPWRIVPKHNLRRGAWSKALDCHSGLAPGINEAPIVDGTFIRDGRRISIVRPAAIEERVYTKLFRHFRDTGQAEHAGMIHGRGRSDLPHMIAVEVSNHRIVKIRCPRRQVPRKVARDPFARRARRVRVRIGFRLAIPCRTGVHQHRGPIRQNKQSSISSSSGYLVNVEGSSRPWRERLSCLRKGRCRGNGGKHEWKNSGAHLYRL